MTDSQGRAFGVATSPETRRAFDLSKEPEKLRDRYGRHIWGQSMLLARRLSQAGVKFVQVNLGDHVNYWDYHSKEDKLMDQHCPPFDKAFSALLRLSSSLPHCTPTMLLLGRIVRCGTESCAAVLAASCSMMMSPEVAR